MIVDTSLPAGAAQTPSEGASGVTLDDAARLAAAACGAPLALVAMDGAHRCHDPDGLIDPAALPRLFELGALLLARGGEPTIVADAAADADLRGHLLVAGAPGLRLCAAAPFAGGGEGADDELGGLCIFDPRARRLDPAQAEALQAEGRLLVAERAARRAAAELELHMRRRAEELQTANTRLREEAAERAALLESIGDGFVSLDRAWRFRYVNRRAGHILLQEPQALLGASVFAVFPEARGHAFHEAAERAVREARPVAIEALYPPTQRWLELRIYPAADGGLSAFFTDVTARRRGEQALRESRAAMRALLDNMVEGVIAADQRGRLTFTNESGRRMLGVCGSSTGKPDILALYAALRVRRPDGTPLPPEESAVARALQGEAVLEDETVVRDPWTGADRVRRANATPIQDGEGRVIGALTVIRDITEIAQLERLKDEFLGVAAHELKTPVAVVKAYAQLLRQLGGPLVQAHAGIVDAIERGADRIDRVVGDLLELSQLDVGRLQLHPSEVALDKLVRETVERMARAEPSHRVRLGTLAPVRLVTDVVRVRQVLRGLVSNAIKYSRAPAEVRVELGVDAAAGVAVVSVHDQGIGIPADRQARIFERFYRAHTDTEYDRGGVGIGLHLGRRLVERLGGRMWFASRQGHGSTFYFTLPLSPRGTQRSTTA